MKVVKMMRIGLLTLPLLVVALMTSSAALAAATGTITGVVIGDQGTAEAGVSVMVLGTEPLLGVITDSEGRFTIKNVPVGTHTLRVLKMGYQTIDKPGTVVGESQTVTVRFNLREAVVKELTEIQVKGERKRIEKDSSTTKQRVSKENLESLPVDTFQEAVGLKAGVVSQGGELHFRGGRSGEVLYMIDGIPVRD